MSMQIRWFIVAVVVSFLGVGMGAFFLFERAFSPELGLGWAVAFADHGLRSIIDRGGSFKRICNLFMGRMAVHGLRAAVFLAAILFIIFKLKVARDPFIFSVFMVYFIFLVYNIVMVYAFPPSGPGLPAGTREAPAGSA